MEGPAGHFLRGVVRDQSHMTSNFRRHAVDQLHAARARRHASFMFRAKSRCGIHRQFATLL